VIRKSDMAVRDNLALERTYLAKERTILSYVRTGLTFLGLSLFIIKFIDLDFGYRLLLSLVFAAPGLYVTVLGTYKLLCNRNWRKEFEEKNVLVNGNEKQD